VAELILLIPIGYLLLASVPLVLIDIREHRLPNRFTYPAILLAFAGNGFTALSQGAYLELISAHLSSIATFGIGYLLAKYASFGMGDVKLITATNHLLAWFSPWLVLFALTASFVLASLVSLFGLISRKLSWQTPVAMDPYLLAGFFMSVGLPAAEFTVAALS
jgi:leader peptidase (prepilin peptidase)/N-methyltransferase